MIGATTSVAAAQSKTWETIVLGAGPAGAIAALGLAREGVDVLLIDRSPFPRDKVCGGCLNGDSLAALDALGLGPRLTGLRGRPLKRFHLAAGRRSLSLELPAGLALSRHTLDALLVEAAIAAGARFLPRTGATVKPCSGPGDLRELTCSRRGEAATLQARVVVMATGLSTDSGSADPDLAILPAPQSRIGVGTRTPSFPAFYEPGTIFMAVSRSGYVGLTRTEGSFLNLAAALDVLSLKAQSPEAVCRRILIEAGFPVSSEMLSLEWRGTLSLTRRRLKPAAKRVFVVGDAAGYVEPFTGEGMAWAIRGGRAVVPLVLEALHGWDPSLAEEWSQLLERLVTHRQKLCRVLSRGLRYPHLVGGVIAVVGAWPGVGRAIIGQLNRESELEPIDTGTGHSPAA